MTIELQVRLLCALEYLKLAVTFSQKLENLLLVGEWGDLARVFCLANERNYNCGVTYPILETVILKIVAIKPDWKM